MPFSFYDFAQSSETGTMSGKWIKLSGALFDPTCK